MGTLNLTQTVTHIVYGAIPIILILSLVMGISPAEGVATKKLGQWSFETSPGNWPDVYGVQAKVKPEIDAVEHHGSPDYEDSRVSDWIGIVNLVPKRWVQLGWYKGMEIPSNPTDCPAQESVMKIYYEWHKGSGSDGCDIHTVGTHSKNVEKTYSLWQAGYWGAGLWKWRPSVDGAWPTYMYVDIQDGRADVGIESWIDPTVNEAKVLHTSIKYLGCCGWTAWYDHESYCDGNKYEVDELTVDTKMRANNGVPPPCE